ncbi:hypothetical protein H6P81_008294 [Aristolochia fimbriata]|uniref:Serine protease inhibitor, Kazal-type family protein n=1 Tax=Aristolochia fimbriata TaxID=158543 RepID=A0AAV7F2L5_ARIFI|nr:hypothetical protein H6P81_008294 [Aristolochia fimbriata]
MVAAYSARVVLFSVFVFLLFSLGSCSSISSQDSSTIRLPSDGEIDGLCAGERPASCPVNCFRTDPVCGEDGVTYWCGCADAMCAGTRVAKLGFCEVGNGGSAPVSGQALLLVHIVWLIVLGISVLFGLF